MGSEQQQQAGVFPWDDKATAEQLEMFLKTLGTTVQAIGELMHQTPNANIKAASLLVSRLGNAISAEGDGVAQGLDPDATIMEMIGEIGGGALGSLALADASIAVIGSILGNPAVAALALANPVTASVAALLVIATMSYAGNEIGGAVGAFVLGLIEFYFDPDAQSETADLLRGISDLLSRLLSDPLVLDLDGDGIELLSLNNGVTQFDIDGDGVLERTGWAAPDDGLLVHDQNLNGVVDGVDELFGNSKVDGFAELAQFDTNKDGKVDGADEKFAELRIWRDLNSNGVSEQGELQTLAQAGIASISLSITNAASEIAGNDVKSYANYTRIDGSLRKIASIDFAVQEVKATLPADADMSDLITLPNLNGQDGLQDLRTAMYFDSSLKQKVVDLIAEESTFETFADFRDGGFLDVIYKWAGLDVSSANVVSEAPIWLQALAKFTGRPLLELSEQQIERVEVAWESLIKQLGVSFLVQVSQIDGLRPLIEAAELFKSLDPNSENFETELEAARATVPSLESRLSDDGYVSRFSGLAFDRITGALIGDFAQIAREFLAEQPSFGTFGFAGGGGGSARPSMSLGEDSGESRHPWTAWYEDQGSLLFQIAQQMGLSEEYVLNITGWRWLAGQATDHDGTSGNDVIDKTVTTYYVTIATSEAITRVPVETRDQRMFGLGGDDVLRGNDGVDRLIGGTGNDHLEGGSGSDMYIYSKGDGADRIVDASGSADALFFSTDLKSSDLTITRVGKTGDLLLQFGSPGDSIVLTGQWGTPSSAIESFNFVGEVTLTTADIASRYLQSLVTSANDQITGSWADEIIYSGDGDDRVSGMEGNDILSGGNGDDSLDGYTGRDQLYGGAGNDYLFGSDNEDVLVGGTGDDTLVGWHGDDIYRFDRGDGQDIISDSHSGFDKVEFGPNILASDLVVSQSADGADLIINFVGTSDQIRLSRTLVDGANRIEEFRFADGTVLNHAQLLQLALTPSDKASVLWGSYNAEVIDAGGGNDEIMASDGNDYLIGGTGNDVLIGWHGDDTYRFNRGDGQDVISDNHSGNDTLEFGAGISPADIAVSQSIDGRDLILSIIGSDDQVQLSRTVSDGGNRIENVRFADGTVWSHAQLLQRAYLDNAGSNSFFGSYDADTIAGGAGNDDINAGDGNDILIGGAGNDTLVGWHGDDTYRFARGDGQDLISDSHSGNDTLEFGAGVAPSDIIVTQSNDGRDLILSIVGTNDQITLIRTLTDGGNRIESVRFADGTAWSHAQLLQRSYLDNTENNIFSGSYDGELIAGGVGNDEINAGDGSDILIGGSGNDTLVGWQGDDTYRFSRGDGQDIITDGHSGTDALEFGAGIAPSDISIFQSTDGRDLILKIAGSDDQVRLVDTVVGGGNRIEWVRFADGTSWSHSQLMQLSQAPSTNSTPILGDSSANNLAGSAANDTFYGREGHDTLTGGLGNDTLYGEGGDDTYIFNLGDGQDILREYAGGSWGGNDRVLFGAGISPADVIVTQAGNGRDFLLSIRGTTDSVLIDESIADGGGYRVESVQFADGTIWSHADLVSKSLVTTAGADRLYGSGGNELLDGGAGNDILDAREGNDTLLGGAGIDTLYGREGHDTLTGGTGNDILYGEGGDDTYVFNLGDGQDIVRDYAGGSWGGNDRILFGAGINPADVIVTQAGNGRDFLLSIRGTNDSILIDETIADGGGYRVESVQFADGTVWSHADLVSRSLVATVGTDRLYGSGGGELLEGGAGSDALDGREGNDSLFGGAGNDTLNGREGHDTLTGGLGNDVLSGEGGDDTYIFNLGDGQDIVREYAGGSWGGNDRVLFGAGISPADVIVTQAGNGRDFLLSIRGTTDSVLIDESIADGGGYRVESVQFADGTIWSHADLVSKSLVTTAGADRLYGSGGNELLDGGAGNDMLDAREGNDTLLGGAGNDTLYGRQGHDTLTGGTGNDILYGEGGDDTYLFSRGDGQDIVRDYGGDSWGGNDRILFGAGINPADVIVTQTGNGRDFLLQLSGTDDRIVLDETVVDGGGYRIEGVQFANGTIWSHADLLRMSLAGTPGSDILSGDTGADDITGGGGDDVLYGREGNDNLRGGTGQDILSGDGGNDTYFFNVGDGQDIIRDYSGSSWGGLDSIQFGAGILPENVSVSLTDGGRDLVLKLIGTNDEIIIDQTVVDDGYRIENVKFANGQSWTHSDMITFASAPRSTSPVQSQSATSETQLFDEGPSTFVQQPTFANDWLVI
ncbi:calcium-binding protein [Sphingomonas rosea]|uniref:calcium-binding protein n=1 Tax=Sphingomonas rosea TaxID=335605 RepID=UPI0031CE2301